MISNRILFLVAHQDDELLTFGGPIAQYASMGYDTYVACFSKGEGSSVKRTLNDGGVCEWHGGSHGHALSVRDFVAARDGEFFESLLALGVPSRNILLPHARQSDGKLAPWDCLNIIEGYIQRYPGIKVATHSPVGNSKQHVDHQALGIAALMLQQQGIIEDLSFWIDPYYHDAFVQEMPEIICEVLVANEQRERLHAAACAYDTWAPEKGKYAIGYHSVSQFHEDMKTKLVFYSHASDSSMLALGLAQWAEKHEKRMQALNSKILSEQVAECEELRKECSSLRKKINGIKNSWSYRIGRTLTKPARLLKRKG